MSERTENTGNSRLWTRSESRRVRPFCYASDYLQDAALRLYKDGEFTTEEVVPEDEVDVARLAPAIRVSKPPAGLDDLVGVSDDLLRFIVLIEDRFLKKTTTLQVAPLHDLLGGVVELGIQAREAASWDSETRLHLAVILAENRAAKIGFASRQGSWIARKTFRVAKRINTASFPIEPVEEDWFIHNGLPASTAYYVQILDPDLDQPSTDIPELVKVFASKALMSALAGNRDSPVRDALVKAIYADVVTTVLVTGMADRQDDPSPGSILDVVITRLAKTSGIPRARLIKFARSRGGGELRAVVQADAELARAMISACRRRIA